MNREAFQKFMYADNVEGSGKASSYVRALDLLCKMLQAHPMGFEDCREIWNVDSIERIKSLYELVKEQSNKGIDSVWNLPDIPVSYLQKGYCSAALKAYEKFLQEPDSQILDHVPKMFCQLSILWLLEQRENLINLMNVDDQSRYTKFFDGDNDKFLFSKLDLSYPEKLESHENDVVIEKIRFLYEETFPYLSSLSRKAPNLAQFVSLNSFPMTTFESLHKSFVLCMQALHSFYNQDRLEIDASGDIIEILSKVQTLRYGLAHSFDSPEFAKKERETPFPISSFISETIDSNHLEFEGDYPTFYDPACGLGSLLLGAIGCFGLESPNQYQGSELDPITGSLCKIGFLFRALTLNLPEDIICELIQEVAPNIRIEDSIARFQVPLRSIRNFLAHERVPVMDDAIGSLPDAKKFDVVFCEPPIEIENQELGFFLEKPHVLFLILSRLLIKSKTESCGMVLVPSFFRIRASDEDARKLMLDEFPPASIYTFKDTEFHSSSFDKAIFEFFSRPKNSGNIYFNTVLRGKSVNQRYAALYDTQESLEVKRSIKCPIDIINTGARVLSQTRILSIEPIPARLPRHSLGQAVRFWEDQIIEINSILGRVEELARYVENEENYNIGKRLGTLNSEKKLRVTKLAAEQISEPEILDLMERFNSKVHGCPYFEIEGPRIALRYLTSDSRKIESFLVRLKRKTTRFKNTTNYIFFTFPDEGEIEPVFFYYWLRAMYDLSLERVFRKRLREEFSSTISKEEIKNEYSDWVIKTILDLEISYPTISIQSDLIVLLKDIYNSHQLSGRRLISSIEGSDRPKATDILGYLLRI